MRGNEMTTAEIISELKDQLPKLKNEISEKDGRIKTLELALQEFVDDCSKLNVWGYSLSTLDKFKQLLDEK